MHARFRRWGMAARERLFNKLSAAPGFEYLLIDNTICRAHGIGRSRGGLTTSIHAAVGALGLQVRLIRTAGQRGDSPHVAVLIDGLDGVSHFIADAAYDSGTLRGKIKDDLRAEADIKANPSCAIKPSLDPELYAERHKVEYFFQRIKRFRLIALRCEKTIPCFMGFASRVAALDWLR